MLLIIILLCSVITTTSTFAIPGEDITIAEFFSLSTQKSPIELWHNPPFRENGATDQQSAAVQERSHRINQYSYIVSKDHLITWTFGNATRDFNISIASCIKMGDVAGVYQFANGSTRYDATARDIVTDLGIGTSRGTRATYATQTLKNALSAYDEIQAFLSEDILLSGSSPIHSKDRRAINFQSEGRILALVIKTLYGLLLGVASVEIAAAISGIKATKGQLAAGAIVGAGGVSIYTIIDIVTDEGGLTGLEPEWMESAASYVANVFMAQLRKVVMLARGAPDNNTGRRYTESELAEALGQLDAYSAWDLETTPLSTNTIDIEGICDQV